MNSPTIVLTLFSYMLSQVTHMNRLKLLDCILGGQLADLVDFWRNTCFAMEAIHFGYLAQLQDINMIFF